LPKLFYGGPAEEPVAHVDFVDDKTRFEDNRVGDHGIVERVCVFGDVEVFLDGTPRVGEEGSVCADTVAVFIRLGDIVGANLDHPAIADLKLTLKLNKPLMLPTFFGAEAAAAEDEHQRVFALQFGEFPAFRSRVRLCLQPRRNRLCLQHVARCAGRLRR
jgi:hypothetical protein